MSKENNLNELLNQGQSLIKSKEFDKALLVYEEIIKIDNLNHQAITRLPIIYLMKERYKDSIEMINRSFKLVKPVIGDYQNLASAYLALKDYDNAINSYKKVVEINPNNLEIYKILGDTQMKIADYQEAVDSYRNALKLSPDQFQQLFDYGASLLYTNKTMEALEVLKNALKIKPDHLECMNKIASSLSTVQDYKASKAMYQKLMTLAPDSLPPIIGYAACLMFEGKYDESINTLEETLEKKPDDIGVRSNLSLLYLAKKNFKEGWKHYDSRILYRNKIDVTKRHDKLKEIFDIDLDKKELKISDKIIILLDAGIGDAILCLSMLKEFYKEYKNISMEVDYRLVGLCKRSFPEMQFYPVRENKHEMITEYDLSQFNKGIYWMSMGKYVRQKIENFPKKNIAYLKPNDNKVKEIEQKLNKDKSIVCGLSWKSSGVSGRYKTASLEKLIPILSINNIRFIDLQYETKNNLVKTSFEKKKLHKNHNIKIEEYKGVDKLDDIDGLTALIENCDIVVTASNVTAHIAGGLGKKTFLFVPFSQGRLWYWQEEGDKSIWYPNVKIFRAESTDNLEGWENEWGTTFEKMAQEIKKELKL
jgi:tetratricopeptide (TPR) repeat protein